VKTYRFSDPSLCVSIIPYGEGKREECRVNRLERPIQPGGRNLDSPALMLFRQQRILLPPSDNPGVPKLRTLDRESNWLAPRLCSAGQTDLRRTLLSGRSFGNLGDDIPGVRFYHFWDGGGIRVGHLERSARTLCSGDLPSHRHRQIADA